jgi:hypothetical protein
MKPKKLTQAERKAWNQIVREMESRGIDPKGRVALIKDFVKLEARIERLSNREEDPVLGNVQTSRAINVAVAERRRLHAALFAGARELEELPPPPTPAQTREREVCTAWALFYGGLDQWHGRSREDRAAREAELTRLYGEAPMRALIMSTASTPANVGEFYEWFEAQA